jgi:hypothetical protein
VDRHAEAWAIHQLHRRPPHGFEPLEAELQQRRHHLAADSSQIDTIELGLLEENFSGGPTIVQEETFVSDIHSWKIRHTAGAKCLDYRGLVKLDLSGT